MGRRKADHPADVERRKKRKLLLKKNKNARQISRAATMRKLSEDEIVLEIQKINAAENAGLADTKMFIRRKHLLAAYKDVKAKKKVLEAREKTAKTVSVKGLNKLLGIVEAKKPEVVVEAPDKENIDTAEKEELEFPPGLPINPALQPPPGISPRPQNSRRPRTHLKMKDPTMEKIYFTPTRRFGEIKVFDPQNLGVSESVIKKHRRNGLEAELFDPLNPASPFYLARPKPGRPHIRNKRRRTTPIVPTNKRKQQPQIGPQIGPSMDPALCSPIAASAGARQIYPNMAGQHKLEVLLSDKMKALVPTSLRVKRGPPKGKTKLKKKTLDIAPDVGKTAAQVAAKSVGKKKAGMVTEKSYDAFLAEIENLV